MTDRTAAASPGLKARMAGVFYLLTILTGGVALLARGALGSLAGLTAAGCYVAVTLLFYHIFKPVSRSLSLLAAFVSLVGCATGALGLRPHGVDISLSSFGVYCLLIGHLIFRSDFLPRALGALMTFAGSGWLTFLLPPLARSLYPYNLLPGLIGEGSLCLWLLLKNVEAPRRAEPASAEGITRRARS